jgi:hypothetical protein
MAADQTRFDRYKLSIGLPGPIRDPPAIWYECCALPAPGSVLGAAQWRNSFYRFYRESVRWQLNLRHVQCRQIADGGCSLTSYPVLSVDNRQLSRAMPP